MNLRRCFLSIIIISELASITALFVACSGNDGERILSGAEPGRIATFVSVRQDTIRTGGIAEIRIQVSNIGSEPVILTFNDQSIYGIEIIDTSGTVALFPCESDSTTRNLTMNPGGTRIAIILFSPAGSHGFCFPSSIDTLPPGHYTVYGGLRGYEDQYLWGRDVLDIIE
jgi:hypothetical protein